MGCTLDAGCSPSAQLLPLPDTPAAHNIPLPQSVTRTMWLKPQRWNQGGYDAIFIDRPASVLRFVQVTIQHHHSFKCQYFNSLIDKLNMTFNTIEVYFIVPEDNLATFTVPDNGHIRTCPHEVKGGLRRAKRGGEREGSCCVGWRKVAGLDWK